MSRGPQHPRSQLSSICFPEVDAHARVSLTVWDQNGMVTRFFTLSSITFGAVLLAGAMIFGPIRETCAQGRQLSYAEDIAPIFKGWCIACHQPGGQGFEASGLDLTTYDGLMKGTKFGPMVIPREPDSSSLIAIVNGRTAPQIRMPYGHKPLPQCLRANIWTWIFEGAKNN